MALMLLFPPMLDVPRYDDMKIVSAGFYFPFRFTVFA
jgi:hypothetical protein